MASHLTKKEQLKADNDFMKMKLMLEKGAQFGNCGSDELNPEIENFFLRNVIEFEKQFEQRKTIKIFAKIGCPSDIKDVALIPDAAIAEAWKKLYSLLEEHGINLSVCSPNISSRELYRFTTEELFEYEMDDVDVPGIIHGFIYDEFHPDLVYDNSRLATIDCISPILCKQPMEWTHYFKKEKLRLNEHYPITVEQLKKIINRFKAAYEDIVLNEISGTHCIVNEKDCLVTGKYLVTVNTGLESCKLTGNWKVVFELDEEFGCWDITEVHIENISF